MSIIYERNFVDLALIVAFSMSTVIIIKYWSILQQQDDLKLPVSARSKFWGVSGSEDRSGGDNSIQFIKIRRVGDKSFKEWRWKMGGGGGGRVGDNNILTFLCYWLHKKKYHFKNCILGNFFYSYL